MRETLRENWRIVALVVLVVASGFVIFTPASGEGPTSLSYGIQLEGGSSLRAELVGVTAKNVPLNESSETPVADLESAVRSRLGLDPLDVRVRPHGSTATVEVRANVTQDRLREALRAIGIDTEGVKVVGTLPKATYETAAEVMQRRLTSGELGGGSASVSQTLTGDRFIRITVPGQQPDQVKDQIQEQGRVQIVATFPVETENGTEYRRVPLLTQGDFRRIGQAEQPSEGNPAGVGVTLRDRAARNFTNAMQKFGFLDEGINACNNQNAETGSGPPGYCLLTVVDGEVVYAADMSGGQRGLAPLLRPDQDGTVPFLANPKFTMTTGQSYEQAQELQLNLQSGALPAEPKFVAESYVEPAQGQEFKLFSLVTGLAAWLAVTGVIFFRYREIRVAVPMLVTAAAEVFILLGFAAVAGLDINLAHIAGFIAVIGTGVDDLVIIADEILQQEDISTGRVFQSRFRKAFWVIGAAAATTIIAMGPLVALDLGDLQGFAIVTIVGVLIGVLVTRPAYGNILRNLLVKD